jgi:hypothetical protein
MEYIAGRPFAVNGGNVEPGDKLTRLQMESIPYPDSFISAGYIYAVYTKNDYDRLPPHVYTAVLNREEAKAAMRQKTALVTEEQAQAQKDGDEDFSRTQAAKQAEIDNAYVANKMIREVDPVNPIPVKEDKTEEEAEVKAEPEAESTPVEKPVEETPKPTTRKTTGK